MSEGKKESSAKSTGMSQSQSNAPGSQSNAPGPVSPRQLDDAPQAATSELGTRPDSVLSIVNRHYPGAQPKTTNPAGHASSGTAAPADLHAVPVDEELAQLDLDNIPDKSKSPGSLKSRLGTAVSDFGKQVLKVKSFVKKEKPQSNAQGEQEDQAQLATTNPSGGDAASSGTAQLDVSGPGEPGVAETSAQPSADKRGKSKSPKSLIGSAAHAARKKLDKVKQFGKRDRGEGEAPKEDDDNKELQNEATEKQDDDNSKGQDDETEKPKTD